MGYFTRLDTLVRDILTNETLSTDQKGTVLSELILHVHVAAVNQLQLFSDRDILKEVRNSSPDFFRSTRRINQYLEGTGIEWEGQVMNESAPDVAEALRSSTKDWPLAAWEHPLAV
jgi:hypothetical protein